MFALKRLSLNGKLSLEEMVEKHEREIRSLMAIDDRKIIEQIHHPKNRKLEQERNRIKSRILSKAKNKHNCPYKFCSRSFPNRNGLQAHMVSHSYARPFECELCHYKFKTTHHLRRHEKEMHLMNFEMFRCPHCDCEFKRKYVLKGHMRTCALNYGNPQL